MNKEKSIEDFDYFVKFYEEEKTKHVPFCQEYGFKEANKEFAEFIKDNALTSTITHISKIYYIEPQKTSSLLKFSSPFAGIFLGLCVHEAFKNSLSSAATDITATSTALGAMFAVEYVAYRKLIKSEEFKTKTKLAKDYIAKMREYRKNDNSIIENSKFEQLTHKENSFKEKDALNF